ncbi:hypothetical protein GCM10023083_41300 [Streptomyces phyllanthi]
MLSTGLLRSCRQVLQKVPSIGHLDGVGSSHLNGLGESHESIAADDFGSGVFEEPGGDRAGLPVGQDIHRDGGLDIDEDGSVGPPPAENELVDAEYPWCPRWHGWGCELSQE